MLSCEERNSLVDAVVRQKVVLDLVQTVMRRGVTTTKGDTQLRCSNSSLLQWERENQYNQMCDSIASDDLMSIEEKLQRIVATVNHIRGSSGMTIGDFVPLTPVLVLRVSLTKLQYGSVSVEFQMALLELVLSYIARGAYDRAGKILQFFSRGKSSLDSQVVAIFGDMTACLRFLGSSDSSIYNSIEEKRFLPLAFHTGEKFHSVEKVSRFLGECKLQELPVTTMLYCYFSAISVSLHMLDRLTEESAAHNIREAFLKRAPLVTTLRELSTLKENARECIRRKAALNLKREEMHKFVSVCLKECEEFVRSNMCDDYGALLAFAFVKIRWEKECGLFPDSSFLESFLSCCRHLQIDDTVFLSIFIADADFALKGKNMPLFSSTCDISAVELPLLRSGMELSCALFERGEVKATKSPSGD